MGMPLSRRHRPALLALLAGQRRGYDMTGELPAASRRHLHSAALEGLGGPASFRARLVPGLQARGVPVVSSPADPAAGDAGDWRHARLNELRRAPARGAHRAAPERHELDPPPALYRRAPFPAL
jgi:hypothetical protein